MECVKCQSNFEITQAKIIEGQLAICDRCAIKMKEDMQHLNVKDLFTLISPTQKRKSIIESQQETASKGQKENFLGNNVLNTKQCKQELTEKKQQNQQMSRVKSARQGTSPQLQRNNSMKGFLTNRQEGSMYNNFMQTAKMPLQNKSQSKKYEKQGRDSQIFSQKSMQYQEQKDSSSLSLLQPQSTGMSALQNVNISEIVAAAEQSSQLSIPFQRKQSCSSLIKGQHQPNTSCSSSSSVKWTGQGIFKNWQGDEDYSKEEETLPKSARQRNQLDLLILANPRIEQVTNKVNSYQQYQYQHSQMLRKQQNIEAKQKQCFQKQKQQDLINQFPFDINDQLNKYLLTDNSQNYAQKKQQIDHNLNNLQYTSPPASISPQTISTTKEIKSYPNNNSNTGQIIRRGSHSLHNNSAIDNGLEQRQSQAQFQQQHHFQIEAQQQNQMEVGFNSNCNSDFLQQQQQQKVCASSMINNNLRESLKINIKSPNSNSSNYYNNLYQIQEKDSQQNTQRQHYQEQHYLAGVNWKLLDLLKELNINSDSKQIELIKCVDHHEIVSLYCEKDKQLLCVNCLFDSELHSKHSVIPLKQSYQLLSDNIQLFKNSLKLKQVQLDSTFKVCTSNRNIIESTLEKTIDSLNKEFSYLKNLISQKQKQLQQEIMSAFEKALYQYDSILSDIKDITSAINSYSNSTNNSNNNNSSSNIVNNIESNTQEHFIFHTLLDIIKHVNMNNINEIKKSDIDVLTIHFKSETKHFISQYASLKGISDRHIGIKSSSTSSSDMNSNNSQTDLSSKQALSKQYLQQASINPNKNNNHGSKPSSSSARDSRNSISPNSYSYVQRTLQAHFSSNNSQKGEHRSISSRSNKQQQQQQQQNKEINQLIGNNQNQQLASNVKKTLDSHIHKYNLEKVPISHISNTVALGNYAVNTNLLKNQLSPNHSRNQSTKHQRTSSSHSTSQKQNSMVSQHQNKKMSEQPVNNLPVPPQNCDKMQIQ